MGRKGSHLHQRYLEPWQLRTIKHLALPPLHSPLTSIWILWHFFLSLTCLERELLCLRCHFLSMRSHCSRPEVKFQSPPQVYSCSLGEPWPSYCQIWTVSPQSLSFDWLTMQTSFYLGLASETSHHSSASLPRILLSFVLLLPDWRRCLFQSPICVMASMASVPITRSFGSCSDSASVPQLPAQHLPCLISWPHPEQHVQNRTRHVPHGVTERIKWRCSLISYRCRGVPATLTASATPNGKAVTMTASQQPLIACLSLLMTLPFLCSTSSYIVQWSLTLSSPFPTTRLPRGPSCSRVTRNFSVASPYRVTLNKLLNYSPPLQKQNRNNEIYLSRTWGGIRPNGFYKQ